MLRLPTATAALLAWMVALGAAAQAAPGPSPAAAPAPPVPAPASEACDSRDLVRAALITGTGLEGSTRTLQDKLIATEGTVWNAPAALRVQNGGAAHVLVDLRGVRDLRYLVLQGDNNDNYVVEGSTDGTAFRPLWTAAPVEPMGLRTRTVVLPKPQSARYLRVRGTGGDGYYSISELRAYCKAPKPWPPALTYPPKLFGWRALDNDSMVLVKGWGAVVGTLLLLAHWLLRRRKKALDVTLDSLLAIVGIVAFACWWNLGHFHFDHYEHIWEHYHYYMGAKYAPELRYSRLYECTAVADMEDGMRARVKKRRMRDLAVTNELGPTDDIMRDPARCTSHFTPERWKAFRDDIRFFRGRFSYQRWDESQTDHGYNGTPVWGIMGRIVANTGELNWTKIRVVAWIDSGLLVLMWVATWWAFGWRATCVALMWWGFNFPARFYWNGGSMLRYDWLLWLVVGICLLKKRHPFSAGMALTYSTLLRIFPGFVVAALMLKALARIVRHRRLVVSRSHLRFAAGCIVAMAILIPASSWAAGGLDAWTEFARNSNKHLHTALTNNMGLKTVIGYDPPTSAKFTRDGNLEDPFYVWKDAREYFYQKREPVLLALILLFCVMLARAGEREPDWATACLGTGLIIIAAELTCYYYGFLLSYGLLWERRKSPGVLATALAAITCFLPSHLIWNDDHFTAMSLWCSIVVILTTAWVAYGPRPRLSPRARRARERPKPAKAPAPAEAPLSIDAGP